MSFSQIGSHSSEFLKPSNLHGLINLELPAQRSLRTIYIHTYKYIVNLCDYIHDPTPDISFYKFSSPEKKTVPYTEDFGVRVCDMLVWHAVYRHA